MITLNKNTATEILDNIKNPAMKKKYADILLGNTVKVVKCYSKQCKGRVIANIQANGKIMDAGGMRSYRERLDGNLGFHCRYCEQNSIRARAEIDTMPANGSAPSKGQLEEIYRRVSKNPTQPRADGTIDGFKIEEVIR